MYKLYVNNQCDNKEKLIKEEPLNNGKSLWWWYSRVDKIVFTLTILFKSSDTNFV